MATFLWSSLTDGQTISAFNPSVDVFRIDDSGISAADIAILGDEPLTTFFYGGKTVTLQTDPRTLTTTNLTFADGSMLLFGDNTTGMVNDDAINTLVGGSGADQFIGMGGADSLVGNGGNDVFTMFTGFTDPSSWNDDTISGGSGIDTVTFEEGPPVGVNVNLATGIATGGDGNPGTIVTLNNIENVDGHRFDDVITGSSAPNVLRGEDGDDTLAGAGGNDTLAGGAGNDTLDGGTGNDRMIGGPGDDTYVVNSAGDVVVELANGGSDTIITSLAIALPLNVENFLFTGGGSFVFTGNAQGNVIGGGSASDTLSGGAGIDTVTYALVDVAVTVNLLTDTATGYGNDIVSEFENATGGTAADVLIGDAGKNALDGGGGTDTMRGGFGDDTYFVDRLTDKVVETSNTAAGGLVLPGNDGAGQAGVAGITDTVIAAVNYTLATLQYLENLTLSGAASRATGNALANKLTGNAGSDTLEGGTGNDTLNGGAGSDRLLGGGGNDTLVWGTGDTLDGGIGVDNLKLAAGNLNLVTLANNKILNVETINMIGGGNNTLTLNASDVLAINAADTLKILGNAGDKVIATGYTQIADLGVYNRYTSGGATLLVESDVTVI